MRIIIISKTILRITINRMTNILHMNTDLMLSTSL